MHQRAFFIIDEDARSKLTEVPIEEVTGRVYAHPEPKAKRRERSAER